MQLSRALSRKEDPKAKILYVNHALLMKLIKEYSFFTHFCFFRVDPLLCIQPHNPLWFCICCHRFHKSFQFVQFFTSVLCSEKKGVEGIAHFEEVQMQQSTKCQH